MGQLFMLDANTLLFIQEHVRNGILTPFFVTITRFGDMGIGWILIAIGLLIYARTSKLGLRCVFALICMLLINDVCLKNLFARTRPYEVVPGLINLIEQQTDFSFPSGHTAVSFAMVAALWKEVSKPWKVSALVLACLIAFSRLYIGVHYPTDVLGGVLSGLIAGMLGGWIADRISKRGGFRIK